MDELSAAYDRWVSAGRPVDGSGAPPAVKRWLIRDTARRFGARVMVETGTYRGDTIAALAPYFDELYTVELAPHLFLHCLERFSGTPNVHLAFGESPRVLRRLAGILDQPTLFYLDAHWSNYGESTWSDGDTARGESDCPIVEELEVLAGLTIPYVVMIDDVRMFGQTADWPELDWMLEHVAREFPGLHAQVHADQIIMTPGERRVPSSG